MNHKISVHKCIGILVDVPSHDDTDTTSASWITIFVEGQQKSIFPAIVAVGIEKKDAKQNQCFHVCIMRAFFSGVLSAFVVCYLVPRKDDFHRCERKENNSSCTKMSVRRAANRSRNRSDIVLNRNANVSLPSDLSFRV